jgi:hypothetical protein
MQLGGIRKLGQWWRSLGTANQIAVIGLAIALLGILPGYLTLRSNRSPQPSPPAGASSTTDVVAGVTNTSLTPSKARGELRLDATYSWSLPAIIWALPRQLTAEEEAALRTPNLAGNVDAQEKLEAMLARRNGVKIGVDTIGEPKLFSELRLIITGQHSSPVLVTGMRANVIKRERPISETLVFGPPEGAGENIQVGFDLDSLSPIAQRFDKEMFLAGPYFATHHVSIKNGEQVVFSIRAFTNKYYCEWEILVEANVDGKRKVFSVRDGSRPFRTTAYADSYGTAYRFDFMKNRFFRLPPGFKPFG